MVEKASFIVSLKNKVSGPGRAAARAIQGVGKGLRSIGRVSDGLGNVVSRLDEVAKRSGVFTGFRKGIRAASSAAAQGAVLFRGLLGTIGGGLKGAADVGVRGLKRLGDGLVRLSRGFLRAAKSAAVLLGSTTGLAAFLTTKGVLGAAQFAEQSRVALTNLTGSAQLGELAFKKSIRLAREYGLDVQETTAQIIKLRAAQFTIGESLELVKLTTDLKTLGATSVEVDSAVRAITQIKAKGRLQGGEILQLAEVGVATTLIYEALSKRLGKTQDEVRKLISVGKVSADVGLAAISDAILKKANIKEAGEAGKKFADATIGGLIGRLRAAPQLLFLRASEASSSIAPEFKKIVKELTKSIESISPRDLTNVVTGVLEIIRGGIPLIKEFAAGFREGFGEALAGFGGVEIGAKGNKELFRTLGEVLARTLGLGIKLVGLFAKGTAVLGNNINGTVLSAGLLFAVMSKGAIVTTSLQSVVLALQAVFISLKIAVFAAGVSFKGTLIALSLVASGAKLAAAGITAFVTGALAIPAALALAGVAIGTLGFIFREEIASFQLKLFDEFFAIGEGLPDAIGRGIRSGIGALFGPLGTLAVAAGEFFRDEVGDNDGRGDARRQTPSEMRADREARSMRNAAAANLAINPAASGIRGGGPRISAPMQITVNIGKDAQPGAVGTEVAQAVQKGIRGAFTTAPQGA